MTERLGHERQARRDQDVAAFRERRLEPRFKDTPQVPVVMADAGKVQTRADDGKPGVREPQWKDEKVGILANYPKPEIPIDYQPEPPAAFLDRTNVPRLCAELERVGKHEPVKASPSEKGKKAPAGKAETTRKTIQSPKPLMRTTVATMGPLELFGLILATEAHLRNFYSAARGAIIGDGAVWIDSLAKTHFDGWVRILDFLHLLAHVWAAACAAFPASSKHAWDLYVTLIRLAWSGKVEDLLEELHRHRRRIGEPAEGVGEKDPRAVLVANIRYITENRSSMDYPAYRRAGFPVTSALVESGIKQYNRRVKGTEKFWRRDGVEAVLQVRAAHLSEDDRAKRHFENRPRAHHAGGPRFRKPA